MTITLQTSYEIGNRISDEPLVYVFEDFLQAQEVKELLAAAGPHLKQALVSAAESGVASEGRTGSNCWVPHNHSPIVTALAHRIADVVGLPLDHAESLQVIHYGPGEEYAAHFDAWDPGTERGRRCMARGGQRMVTCLLYLNEVETGGDTAFPNLDMQVEARPGRMLLFHNCHPASTVRHPDSLHGGLPVIAGEKWACNLWFREAPYQPPGETPERPQTDAPDFNRVI